MSTPAKASRAQTVRDSKTSAMPHVRRRGIAADSDAEPGVEAAGNLAIQGSLKARGVRAKMALTQPSDQDERDADQIADTVMSGANVPAIAATTGSRLARKCSSCASAVPCDSCDEEHRIAAKMEPGASAETVRNLDEIASTVRSGGQPLGPDVRSELEPRFGHDLGHVRVHTDPRAAKAARSIGARAFTHGAHIAFAPGEYRPAEREGKRLLAHELAHVAQNSVSPRSAETIQRQPDPNAGAQGQGAHAPPNKPLYYYRGVVMTTDEAFMADELRRLIAREGIEGADRWYLKMVEDKGIPPQVVGFGVSAHAYGSGTRVRSPIDAQRDMAEQQLVANTAPVVMRIYKDVRLEALKFLEQFELRSKVVLEAMLQLSETKVQAEQQRYGLKTEGVQGVLMNPAMTKRYGTIEYYGAKYSMQEGPAKKGLGDAAKKLADRLRKLSKKWAEETRYMGVDSDGESMGTLYVKDQAGHARWQKEFEQVEFDYLLDRAAAVSEFPILASFATTTTKGTAYLDASADKLEKVSGAPTSDVAEMLNKDANEKLANIYKTRWAIDEGELSVWKLESIVAGTKSTLNVKPGSMQERVINDKIEQEKSKDTYFKLAIAALAIALGILAAIPTGGSSLVAGITIAAGIGSAALSVTIAYSDLKEYAIQSAASGTDFEKAQAISQDEPSLFWLALSIVGAVVDIGAAASAFKALAPAARQLQEAKRLAALGRLSAEENAAAKLAHADLARQAEKFPGLAEKLEARLAEVAGDEAKNTERLAARWEEGLNTETKAALEANAGAKALYKDMDPVVRDILTHCASICIIPNLTNRQYAEIKAIVYEHGAEELGGLKQYFHFRRNALDAAIKDLKEAKGLEDIKALLQRTLTSAPVQAEEDAVLTWSRLQQTGATTESKADFIEKYRAGLRYDEGAHTWYNPVRGLKDTVPLGATASEALQAFKGSEGFAPFQKLLQDEKLIASEDDLVKVLEGMKPSFRGRPVDAVRHSLKDVYRDALLAKMTHPNEALARVRYPDLPWTNVDDAMRQASYREMRRMTDGLASSDKGNLFESWYKATLSPTGAQHVEVDVAKLKSLGSSYEKSRILDLVEGDAIHELKRVSGPLGEHDLGQFSDNMLMVSKKLEVAGQPLRKATYTFPIPEGVQANAKWMKQQLALHQNVLTFEVFNAAGERRLLSAAGDLDKPEFWTWLGLAKPK